jgi:hypothetical protein
MIIKKNHNQLYDKGSIDMIIQKSGEFYYSN